MTPNDSEGKSEVSTTRRSKADDGKIEEMPEDISKKDGKRSPPKESSARLGKQSNKRQDSCPHERGAEQQTSNKIQAENKQSE